MTIKEKIYRAFLLFIVLIRIYKRSISLFRLKFFLFLYAFAALVLMKYLDVIHRGDVPRSFISYLSLTCLLLIEPLNQFTFYYAKKNRRKAKIIKASVFWILFTIYCITDIYIRLQVEKTGGWVWAEDWPTVFVILGLSACIPWYSFCPDIRYICLVGNFQLYDKKPMHEEPEKVGNDTK